MSNTNTNTNTNTDALVARIINRDEMSKWRQHMTKVKVTGKKTRRGLFLSDRAIDGLRELAEANNCYHGSSPSISELIERIGAGNFMVLDDRQLEQLIDERIRAVYDALET